MERQGAAELLAWGVWDLPETDLDVQQLKTAYQTARAVYEDFLEEVKRLKDSDRFSEMGLRQEVGALAGKRLAKLEDLRKNVVEPREGKLSRMFAEMAPRSGDMVAAMRQSEVRALLLNSTREEAFGVVRSSLEHEDLEVLDSIVQGSTLFRKRLGLDERLVEELRQKTIEMRADPEVLAQQGQLRKAIHLTLQALNTATKTLVGSAGQPAESRKEQVAEQPAAALGGKEGK